MTPLRHAGPSTIAVVGSCISRDNFRGRFNPDWRERFAVVHATMHSSLMSVMSAPVDLPWEQHEDGEPWTGWNPDNIDPDLLKKALPGLLQSRPDYLVVDLFPDTFHGVAVLTDGRVITANWWGIQRTSLWHRWQAEGSLTLLHPLTDGWVYVERWRTAMHAFVAWVREQLPATVLVLQCGRLVETLRNGWNGEIEPFSYRRPVSGFSAFTGNLWWRRLEDELAPLCDAVIDLHDRDWSTMREHPWAAHWVHYELEFYRRFLADFIELDDHRRALAAEPEPELAPTSPYP